LPKAFAKIQNLPCASADLNVSEIRDQQAIFSPVEESAKCYRFSAVLRHRDYREITGRLDEICNVPVTDTKAIY
jgi:hypothetical protein